MHWISFLNQEDLEGLDDSEKRSDGAEAQVFNIYSQYGLCLALSQVIFQVFSWLHRYAKAEKFFHHFITFLAFVKILTLYFFCQNLLGSLPHCPTFYPSLRKK